MLLVACCCCYWYFFFLTLHRMHRYTLLLILSWCKVHKHSIRRFFSNGSQLVRKLTKKKKSQSMRAPNDVYSYAMCNVMCMFGCCVYEEKGKCWACMRCFSFFFLLSFVGEPQNLKKNEMWVQECSDMCVSVCVSVFLCILCLWNARVIDLASSEIYFTIAQQRATCQ